MSIFLEREKFGGTQVIHKFDNGYGASVIQHEFSYGGDEGLYELAVLKFEGDNWQIITDDILGYLSEQDVVERLNQIEGLKQ